MKSILQYWFAVFSYCVLPMFLSSGGFKGGDKAQSTTSNSTNYDNRQVNTTSDSNNTTMQWDQSQGSHNSYTSITDGGAIEQMSGAAKAAINAALSLGQSALGNATSQSLHAYDYADGIFDGALGAVQDAGTRELAVFDRAATIQNDALATVKAASSNAADLVKAAYADAKGTTDSQKQIMLGVLAVAGVMALAAFKARA